MLLRNRANETERVSHIILVDGWIAPLDSDVK